MKKIKIALALALAAALSLSAPLAVSAVQPGENGISTGETPYKSYTYWTDYDNREKIPAYSKPMYKVATQTVKSMMLQPIKAAGYTCLTAVIRRFTFSERTISPKGKLRT